MLTRVNLFLNQSQKSKELFLQTPKTGGFASQGGIIQRELIGNHGLSRSVKEVLSQRKTWLRFLYWYTRHLFSFKLFALQRRIQTKMIIHLFV